MGKPKRSKDAKRNSQELSANTSDVGIALGQAPAPLPVVERRRAASLTVAAFSSRYRALEEAVTVCPSVCLSVRLSVSRSVCLLSVCLSS